MKEDIGEMQWCKWGSTTKALTGLDNHLVIADSNSVKPSLWSAYCRCGKRELFPLDKSAFVPNSICNHAGP